MYVMIKKFLRASFIMALSVGVSSYAEMVYGHCGLSISQDSQGRRVEIRWDGLKGVGAFQVAIDDSPYFRHPVVERKVKSRRVTIDVLESGLAPGIAYFVLIKPGAIRASFRIQHRAWSEPLPDADYLRKAWETTGREWLHRFSGVKWNGGQKNWEVDQQWPHADTDVGSQAYYIEYAARGAVNLALVGHDLWIMDELSGFYLAYLKRFTTLGNLRQRKSLFVSTKLLDYQGSDSARTLAWLEKEGLRSSLRECLLCNSQFFHPVGRLIRIISTLQGSERTPVMKELIASYVPLIVRDHLLRFVYEAQWDYWGAKELPKELINIWRTIIGACAPHKLSYQRAMLDRDLWLIATAAELLGANANDPELVFLNAGELVRLREIVQVGVQLFQKKRTVYRDTRNFQGQLVRSASCFNGDMDDHPEMAYAAYNGKSFPSASQKQPPHRGSWDISHSYRVPVFLRSLYDNRKATGLAFPQAHDIELVINQYMYRVFNGDFDRPLFKNFFDGNDGWYSIDHAAASGYPPSRDCDSHSESQRPCLTAGAISGWGLIAFFHKDLIDLQYALIKLALSRDLEVARFRARYYEFNAQPFAFTDAQGRLQYPFLLFVVLSAVPEQVL